jgi:anti-sigma B factor antagonist
VHIEEQKRNNVFIVTVLDERLDASIAYDFKEKMEGYIAGGERFIVLKLACVDFIDSSGLGAIVSSLKVLGGDGDIVICGAGEAVMRVFKLSRMNKVFRMCESEDDAIGVLSEHE